MANLFSRLNIEVRQSDKPEKENNEMPENSREDILVMALFMVTRDHVLTCANELGIPEEAVTDDMIELVKERVSQDLGDWHGIIKNIVKETVNKVASKCPLGLTCSPYCTWQEVGECILPKR